MLVDDRGLGGKSKHAGIWAVILAEIWECVREMWGVFKSWGNVLFIGAHTKSPVFDCMECVGL
jgi:hypothetical protein